MVLVVGGTIGACCNTGHGAESLCADPHPGSVMVHSATPLLIGGVCREHRLNCRFMDYT